MLAHCMALKEGTSPGHTHAHMIVLTLGIHPARYCVCVCVCLRRLPEMLMISTLLYQTVTAHMHNALIDLNTLMNF